MKTTYQLDTSDLKLAIEAWMAAQGTPVTDADEYSVDPTGTVTIVVTAGPGGSLVPVVSSVLVPLVPKVAPMPLVVADAEGPTVAVPVTGHIVTVDPPLSVTGRATIFGLNYDGSVDGGDNGDGFFTDPATGKPYATRNKTLIGCSLPREVLLSTFLTVDSWKTAGIDSVWAQHAGVLQSYVSTSKPSLTIDANGSTVHNVPLVDAGPSANTGNAIDLTYATAHALQTNGDATATFMILVAGQLVTIRGWDFANGRVG